MPCAGMNVVAVPLAEKDAVTFPKAAGTTTAVAEAVNVAVSWADPAPKAEPVADELNEPFNVPLP